MYSDWCILSRYESAQGKHTYRTLIWEKFGPIEMVDIKAETAVNA